jgi:hypothetical protein
MQEVFVIEIPGNLWCCDDEKVWEKIGDFYTWKILDEVSVVVMFG